MPRASALCPSKCLCPLELARCAPGISLVPDGCGCCKVCARQLNEDCSKTEPCDHIKGLECNFGSGYGTAKGICRAKSDGRPCEYNSKIYQNGESFSANCKHQCTCMDGTLGCVSLCPQQLSQPKLGCAEHKPVKVPGRCCEELVCPEEEGKVVGSASVEKKVSKDGCKDKHSDDDLTKRNELVSVIRGLNSLAAFRSKPESRLMSKGNRRCVAQTTAKSLCSKSCGTGVSSRVTNNNSQCKLVKVTRLCEVRPCSQSAYSILKKGKKCSRIAKASRPVKLSYAGCSSVKKFHPRYCGSCLDGRCCTPQQTQTVAVRFRCEDGDTFSKDVMVIESYSCDFNSPHNNKKPSGLSNDIRKSRG
ncbi:CCN family member 1-like [Coregonus clupeaformis]|uniref:CCN family member 1-like n=1 Tax=Coregonus clupeaformis TaxID=59861 RepID=UPI001E1C4CEA|nr:CCN family member 1-like [Coregonus clupeaformis]